LAISRARDAGPKWSGCSRGADTAQVATATINAAERGLNLASDDKAIVEIVWLLT
jgi:hypothetical protein